MSRTSNATPCPAPFYRARRISTLTIDSLSDDTANIEYTREIQPNLLNAKPIRKTSTNALKSRKNAPIQIFEDVLEDKELVIDASKKLEGRMLLRRPAQKIPGWKAEPDGDSHHLREASQAGRRSSFFPLQPIGPRQPKQIDTVVNRNSRRRTIFVPTDDTTIMTIHPGADSTEKIDDTFHMVGQSGENDNGNQHGESVLLSRPVRRPRQSFAPRRRPLGHVEVAGNASGIDMPGQGGGKENIPPRDSDLSDEKKEDKPSATPDPIRLRRVSSKASNAARTTSSPKQKGPTAAPRTRQFATAHKSARASGSLNTGVTSKSNSLYDETRPIQLSKYLASGLICQRSSDIGDRMVCEKRRRVPDDFLVVEKPQLCDIIASRRNQMLNAKLKQYPVLSEDIAQPDLYEDEWLSQQEVALTEIINEIFALEKKPSIVERASKIKTLRTSMIEMYHQPEVSILHRRLQASLLCGSLKRPIDSNSHSNLSRDLGLRKRFLSLWLDTYEEEALRTAAEVVVGRQMPSRSTRSADTLRETESLLDPLAGRRVLTDFLETFFVNVSDVEVGQTNDGIEDSRYRKTVLRSLMLIWLLDQAKSLTAVDGCLFKTKSTQKSSMEVLQALSGLLMPSVGDLLRVLRHMDFQVVHIQIPLAEVEYRVENLAVDLRDGIILGKLTELLVFQKKYPSLNQPGPELDTTNEHSNPILQYINVPAVSRIQKLHNVNISLSDLSSQNALSLKTLISVEAADIVDGHREKTLQLLWSLVSVHGLEHLIDFRALFDSLKIPKSPGNDKHTPQTLLQTWANSHARAANLPPISNLTTNFADGKIYAAILSSHLPFSPPPSSTLDSLLKSSGFSQKFTSSLVLSSTLSLIPSRVTTLLNLAIFAHKLFPISQKREAAAKKIQKFWRKFSASGKSPLGDLDERCRKDSRDREGRVDGELTGLAEREERERAAAVIIQRAWRGVVGRRLGELERDVRGFQAGCRGWRTRKELGLERGVGWGWGEEGGD